MNKNILNYTIKLPEYIDFEDEFSKYYIQSISAILCYTLNNLNLKETRSFLNKKNIDEICGREALMLDGFGNVLCYDENDKDIKNKDILAFYIDTDFKILNLIISTFKPKEKVDKYINLFIDKIINKEPKKWMCNFK